MPLVIDGKRLRVTQPIARIVHMHPQLMEGAKALTGQATHIFGPKDFLYVQQRELAATTPNDSSVSILGSEDATTCHILVLRHTGSGATCLAHCDGSNTEKEVADILSSVKSLTQTSEGRLQLHIVGGFNDQRQLSQKLSHQLLSGYHSNWQLDAQEYFVPNVMGHVGGSAFLVTHIYKHMAFDKQPEEIHLATFCVTDLNDKKENGIHLPIIYGLAVNVKTGEIFKAKFEDHHPDEDLRSANILTGGSMVNIYDAKAEQLNIGPYSWTTFPNIEFWLEEDDEQILHSFSTSPLAEPPHFVKHMRSTLQFLKDNPHPRISIFPDGKPNSYKKNPNGLWKRI